MRVSFGINATNERPVGYPETTRDREHRLGPWPLSSVRLCQKIFWCAESIIGPAHQHAAGGVAGANRNQQHQIAFAKPLLLHGVPKTERNCPTCGIRVAVDI